MCVSVFVIFPLFRSQNSFLLSFLNVAFNQSQLGRRETCKPVPDEGTDVRADDDGDYRPAEDPVSRSAAAGHSDR